MDQNNQIFTSLISGLIGSLIGGLVTFLVTRYSIKRTTEETMGIERKKRGWVKEDQEKSAIDALLIETEENLKSIERWDSYHSKFRFANESWELNKATLYSVSVELKDKIIRSYTEISRHNTLIDYDLRVPHGLGSKDAEIERQIANTKEALTNLLSELKK